MHTAAIQFETFAPPAIPDPARMDVVCFIGLVASRPHASIPAGLAADLKQSLGRVDADLGGPDGLLNVPVPVTSVTEFEALFDPDTRLEQQAVVEGGRLAETLPGSGLPDTLDIVIDGVIREVALAPLPTTPDALVQRIAAAGLGLEVSLVDRSGTRSLRLALPQSRGPATLAVLPFASYGFPHTRRAAAHALPSPMGQAVRQFFAMGGRKAVILRMGDPIAYDVPREQRNAALVRLLIRPPGPSAWGIGDAHAALAASPPPPSIEAGARYGLTHAYGLVDTTFLCLPDLAELTAPPPRFAAERAEPPARQEVFSECLSPSAEAGDVAQSPYLAPEHDALGVGLWTACVERVVDFLRAYERDKLFISALPRTARSVAPVVPPESAFLQLAETWVRTPFSMASPEGLMAPDAVLAGHLARVTLQQGTYLSAAAVPVTGVRDLERRREASERPTCRLTLGPRGVVLDADLTTSADPAWADGPVSRLMALLLRQARRLGEDLVFEPSTPGLWARVEVAMGGLLEAARLQGALAGEGAGDSYTVRCDRTTMAQPDIDSGRLIAEVSFRPARPVARIRVRLPLTGDPGTVTGGGGVQ